MLPALFAALFSRRPYFICEQNAILGAANRLASLFSTRIFLNIPLEKSSRGIKKKQRQGKVLLAGNPIRPHLLEHLENSYSKADEQEPQMENDMNKPFVCLALGGSQGSVQINRMISDILDETPYSEFQWTIQCGEKNRNDGDLKRKAQLLKAELLGYTSDIQKYYSRADLIICRSGAGVVSEAMCFGLPMLLIPYPYAADGHQEANARFISQAGAGIMLKQKDNDTEALKKALLELYSNSDKLTNMRRASEKLARPHAARDIVESMLSTLECSRA